MKTDKIIQGGMGIGVSNWVLANAVASAGQIGVVSSAGLDAILARRLQDGDPGENIRQAMSHFFDQEFAEVILKKYYIPGGKDSTKPYINIPMLTARPTPEQEKLVMLANFVEVFLAKKGHAGKIGINLLEKIQLPILPSLFGAMLAGVDYILMGAGIPREIPAILDKLTRLEDIEYKLSVSGAVASDNYRLSLSPKTILKNHAPQLSRPKFFAIVSSTALAMNLCKKVTPPVDGLVIELPVAGGHNAPPRGKTQLNERGEPIYGTRDEVDLKVIAELGVPFFLAGAMGSSQGLNEALKAGATGIQVGTAFALCNESGLERTLKDQIIKKAASNELDVFTDPLASPTGFPFKVARLPETNSKKNIYEARTRRCDLGLLRETYKKPDATIGYRCAAEPVDHFLKKGGTAEETVGRKCLCNGLFADVGLAQVTGDIKEKPLVTIGDDVKNIRNFLSKGNTFSASDVIDVLLS